MPDALTLTRPQWWADWHFRTWPTDWPDGREQHWRREWPALNIAVPGEWWGVGKRHTAHVAVPLTGPEVAATNAAGRVCRARYEVDHDVLAVMGATTLKGVEVNLGPYRGRELELPDDDDAILDEYQRKGSAAATKLTAGDVRQAVPRFALAWQAIDALAEPFTWRGGYAEDGHPVTALSRYQLGAWCALSERKARMFSALLVREGIVVPVPLAELTQGRERNLYALSRQ